MWIQLNTLHSLLSSHKHYSYLMQDEDPNSTLVSPYGHANVKAERSRSIKEAACTLTEQSINNFPLGIYNKEPERP